MKKMTNFCFFSFISAFRVFSLSEKFENGSYRRKDKRKIDFAGKIRNR